VVVDRLFPNSFSRAKVYNAGLVRQLDRVSGLVVAEGPYRPLVVLQSYLDKTANLANGRPTRVDSTNTQVESVVPFNMNLIVVFCYSNHISEHTVPNSSQRCTKYWIPPAPTAQQSLVGQGLFVIEASR
jgi:hypothetical protein